MTTEDKIIKYEIMYVGEKEEKSERNPLLDTNDPRRKITFQKDKWKAVTEEFHKIMKGKANKINWKFRIREVDPPDVEVENLNKRMDELEGEKETNIVILPKTSEQPKKRGKRPNA